MNEAGEDKDLTTNMPASIVSDPSKQTRAQFLRITESVNEQLETEMECQPYFVELRNLDPSQLDHLRQTGLLSDDSFDIMLVKAKHVDYLQSCFSDSLKSHFATMDASRAWVIYWTLHSCDLLDSLPTREICEAMVDTLESFYRDGGFGGGPGQLPHAAPTYAAVLALCILASVTPKAIVLLKRIRQPLLEWILSLLGEDGSFRMHEDGEIDVRATYCLMAVAKLLNLDFSAHKSKIISFCATCQTFEGGFGGEPWGEAHGGYAFCATAALYIMQGLDQIDLPALTGWLARRQHSYEGGFNGRANKLVDGCYSFWQGGAIAIVSNLRHTSSDPWLDDDTVKDCLFDQGMLQRYILLCAQDVRGGLRDKPSKVRDFYHSCYNLSGLSVSQHYCSEPGFGHAATRIARTHPVYNIRVERARHILQVFEEAL
jgi:protein farnesyltransferase subunit beta